MKLLKAFMRNPRAGMFAVAALATVAVTPVAAAILVNNSVDLNVSVEDSPISVEAGADDASNFVTVTSSTAANDDGDTQLISTDVSFTCFAGEKTIISDILGVVNNSSDTWEIAYSIDSASVGNNDFTADANGDADIYTYVSTADASTPLTTNPVSTPADWNTDVLQVEYESGTSKIGDPVGSGSIAGENYTAGEERQIALVIDCGENLSDEVGGGTGSFTIDITATAQ